MFDDAETLAILAVDPCEHHRAPRGDPALVDESAKRRGADGDESI